jgi:predicted transcriptional regulator
MTTDDQLSKFTEMDRRRQKLNTAKYFLDLQKSERLVAKIAGQIYAAYIQANKVNNDNKDEMIQKSVHEAARIADWTDKLVKDSEENTADSSSSF